MAGKVILEVTEGPLRGKVFNFKEHDTFIFGRDPECHARLSPDDITASRHHFILEANPPDANIRDLGSLNGTYVNERRHGGRDRQETPEQGARRDYPEIKLKDGDRIRVGKTVFVVRVDLPAVCCDCGRDIPDMIKSACQWVAGTFICPGCRQKAEEAGKPPKRSEPIRCSQCGKDVTNEVGNRQRGDYVCSSCREKVGLDPIEALVKMLLKAGGERDESSPRDIPGYEVINILGKGGMGAVYLAQRKKDGVKVAIKVMLSKVAVDEHARKVFQREIDLTRKLRHKNIVELLDHGSAGSGFYFVMELCPEGSVDALMERQGGKLSLTEAVPIMLKTLEGLSHAHENGLVHRDLKPQNLLLSTKDGSIAKISDFGLSKNFDKAGFSGMTATGAVAGTPVFMPREQVTNFKYVKPVSDVWSIAATFYNMLTGKFPREFPHGKPAVEVILRQPVVPIRKHDSSIPKRVAEVINCALDDKIKNRYQTAKEFHQALERVL